MDYFSDRICGMKFKRWHIIGIAALVALLIFGVVLTRGKTVTITLEGQTLEFQTKALTIGGALHSAGIEVGGKDFVSPSTGKFLHDGQDIVVKKASQVTIRRNGEEVQIESIERTPTTWLDEAGISLNPNDQILLSGQIIPPNQEVAYAPAYSLDIRAAVEVTVHIGGVVQTIHSAMPTLGQALWEAGIQLHEADQLTPPPETPLDAPLSVAINPSQAISIQADGQEYHSFAPESSVGDALALSGIALQGLDYSVPSEDQPVPEDGVIKVVRVVEDVVLETEYIPNWTEWQAVEDLEIDHFHVVDFGTQGLEAKTVRIRYEDGVEVSRVEGEKWVAREPQPRIEGYGTKIVIRTLDTPDGPIEYWRALEMYATSYHPCSDLANTGRCWTGTAGGLKVERGVVGVRYSWWKKMNATTFVYISGYGKAVISDYGTNTVFPNDYWIDLGYGDDDYQSWHQWVTVYFILPLPPPEDIVYVLPLG
jgi:uncharacterized protein YabE (DUF348 family)